ncbi:class I SAM-dependent methyltransferase [Candidatus Peribacteria bacterium]|nr:class I SAM-dependent methyltransferase [Candidatus Peribacteria bacterium]
MALKQSTYWSKKYPVKTQGVHPFAKAMFKRLPKKPGKLLDLGCGYGDDALYFARRGWNVTGLDFSAESMRRLRKRLEKKNVAVVPVQHDIKKRLPFPDNSFDALFAHLSVHYFDDTTTERIFTEMRRVLRKGGLLFVKCKSVDDALYGKGKRIGSDTYKSDHVRHFFSADYMREKLRHCEIKNIRKSSGIYDTHKSAFVEAFAKKN